MYTGLHPNSRRIVGNLLSPAHKREVGAERSPSECEDELLLLFHHFADLEAMSVASSDSGDDVQLLSLHHDKPVSPRLLSTPSRADLPRSSSPTLLSRDCAFTALQVHGPLVELTHKRFPLSAVPRSSSRRPRTRSPSALGTGRYGSTTSTRVLAVLTKQPTPTAVRSTPH